MDKTQIILYAAVIAFAAFRLYQKFSGRSKNKSAEKPRNNDLSSSKDDYEPYSGHK